MKKKIKSTIFVIVISLFMVHSTFILSKPAPSTNIINFQVSSTELLSEANLKFLSSNFNITSDSSKYQNGLNIFGLIQGNSNQYMLVNNSYIAILDMDGNFVQTPLLGVEMVGDISLLNDTTIMGIMDEQPIFWNFRTNETVRFDITENLHHDYEYNPDTESIMALEYYEVPVINPIGQSVIMNVDRIREYSKTGKILFEWELDKHINFSWYYDNLKILGEDIPYFKGKFDPTHANSLIWDNNEDKLYLNVRHFNQFYKIDHNTGNVDWIAGQNGNFTLKKADGTVVDSLWYYSHDVTHLGNNEFMIFDNGNKNITDPNHTYSSILKIIVDTENWEIRETFRYQPDKNDYSPIWGGADLLDNGNYLGAFGPLSHGTDSRNETTAFHNNYGGVAIEVNPAGEEVWRLEVPYNWGFYRMHRVIPKLTIGTQSDQKMTADQNLNLDWNAYSNFPETYTILIDNTIEIEDTWNGEKISYTLSGLNEGSYSITLEIKDSAGNMKSVSSDLTVDKSTKTNDSPIMNYLNIFFVLLILKIVIKRKKDV